MSKKRKINLNITDKEKITLEYKRLIYIIEITFVGYLMTSAIFKFKLNVLKKYIRDDSGEEDLILVHNKSYNDYIFIPFTYPHNKFNIKGLIFECVQKELDGRITVNIKLNDIYY